MNTTNENTPVARKRGFEVVCESKRKHYVNAMVGDVIHQLYVDIDLPIRSDAGSAGYDFSLPSDVTIMPGETKIVFTDVKAYMQKDEVLQLYPRSSLGVKQGIILANTVGIIDSSYYENEDNDGNIGLPLKNTSGKAIELGQGERVAQGIFTKFLSSDNKEVLGSERLGGFGSSGR